MKKREGVFLINKKKEINNNGGIDKTKTPSSTDPRYADSSYRVPKGLPGFKPRPQTNDFKSAAEAAEEMRYKHPGAAKIYTP